MGKKRIGLLTWYQGTNYGSVLQAYALLRTISKEGHKAVIISEFSYPFTFSAILNNLWRRIGFSIRVFHGLELRRIRPLQNCPYPTQKKRFLDFFNEEIKSTLPVGPGSLAVLKFRTQLFMAGSDQLWNCHDHFRELEFLGFAKGKKKVSYATSIGADNIPTRYHTKVKEYLSRFSYISVREKYSEEELERITGRDDIRTVLDPTFLLTADEWNAFTANASTDFDLSGRFIFCYLLKKGHNYEDLLSRIKSLTGIDRVIILPSSENPSLCVDGCERYENAGPREFVKALSMASYVVTDSFHGSALSINFGKPFLNLKRFDDSDPASQNPRLVYLANLFNLGDRFFVDDLPKEINYKSVHEKLDELRKESLDYLKMIIS